MQTVPLCPITGLPASRRIQPISARLISELWRWAFGVKTERQLAGIQHGLHALHRRVIQEQVADHEHPPAPTRLLDQ